MSCVFWIVDSIYIKNIFVILLCRHVSVYFPKNDLIKLPSVCPCFLKFNL